MSRKSREHRRALRQQSQQQQPQQQQIPGAGPFAELLSPANPAHAMVRQWMASLSVSAYSGPLPPPDVLQKYNEIEPGLVDRMVKMAEQQSLHRQHLESTVILERTRNERRGQTLGFIVALVAIVGSFALVAMGKDAVGLTGLLGTIATLAGVFVYSRISQRNENAEKRTAIAQPPPPIQPPPIS